MIEDLAKRLGIDSERIIRKAQEFQRLFQLKTSGAAGFQVKGTGHLVICLELAAKAEHVTVEKDLSIKLSGMKKPLYNSTKQTIMQVLGLFQDLSTKDVCVQLGCPEIVEDVEKLLKLYQLQSCNGQTDVDHPGFKAAAIAALSKIRKLGVDRPKLFELSALKKSVFDKLVNSMIELQQKQDKEKPVVKVAKKRPHSFIEAVESKAKSLEEEDGKKEAECQDNIIDFAAWKRRMLQEAQTGEKE